MDNKEFFAALDELCKDKGINEEEFIETLKNALNSAYKKQYGGADVYVNIDRENGLFDCSAVKKVVAEVVDKDKEISVEDAQAINPEYAEGDEIVRTFVPQDFGRIAAQTAKQVILQKLREKERDNTFSALSDKEGELVEATVRKVDDKNVYVDFSDRKIEGVMLPQDQSPVEKYMVKDVIKVFVRRVKTGGRNSQVLVSRTAPGLVKKLFEQIVPEIGQGLVEIKYVAREAGHRSKIAVYSADSRVDAVGACIGNKGSRVNSITEELGGEKVDVVLWSENPLEFIAKSLQPATVISVTQTGEKSAVAVVPDDKLSLAIGRDGQNARLAARLTNWKIDVKDETTAEQMGLLAYDTEGVEEGAEEVNDGAVEETAETVETTEE